MRKNSVRSGCVISSLIIEFMNLDDSEVLSSDFLGLRNLCSLCNLTGLTSLYSPISSKNFLILIVWTFLAPKWPILVLFFEMDQQKSNFSLIFDTLSVRGCWGQPMLLSWKLVEETQKSTPSEPTRHHNWIKLWNFLPLRADLYVTLHYEIPCTIFDLFLSNQFSSKWIVIALAIVSRSQNSI